MYSRVRRLERRDLLLVLAAIVGVNLLGASPAFVVRSDTSWIDRPWFFPPELAFPIVWTLLFTLLRSLSRSSIVGERTGGQSESRSPRLRCSSR